MITMYGSRICIDCRNFLALMASRKLEKEFQLVDITENTTNMKRFLTLRDHQPVFAGVRTREPESGIGIPAFQKEDGTLTLSEDEALSWIGQPPMTEAEQVEKR